MSDRKYRQRGYQDEPRQQGPKPSARPPQAPRAPGRQLQDPAGPKTPNLMASHEVFKCSRCGNRLSLPVGREERCSRCGVDLHACSQCTSFDPGSRFECMQQIPARVTPKNAKNSCTFYSARTTVERETTAPRPDNARKAFDDLFKF